MPDAKERGVPDGLHPDYPEPLPPPSDPKDAEGHARLWIPEQKSKPSKRSLKYNRG